MTGFGSPPYDTANLPVGAIIMAGGPPDSRWLPCDGGVLSKNQYPALWAVLGHRHLAAIGRSQIRRPLPNGHEAPTGSCTYYNGAVYRSANNALANVYVFFKQPVDLWSAPTAWQADANAYVVGPVIVDTSEYAAGYAHVMPFSLPGQTVRASMNTTNGGSSWNAWWVSGYEVYPGTMFSYFRGGGTTKYTIAGTDFTAAGCNCLSGLAQPSSVGWAGAVTSGDEVRGVNYDPGTGNFVLAGRNSTTTALIFKGTTPSVGAWLTRTAVTVTANRTPHGTLAVAGANCYCAPAATNGWAWTTDGGATWSFTALSSTYGTVQPWFMEFVGGEYVSLVANGRYMDFWASRTLGASWYLKKRVDLLAAFNNRFSPGVFSAASKIQDMAEQAIDVTPTGNLFGIGGATTTINSRLVYYSHGWYVVLAEMYVVHRTTPGGVALKLPLVSNRIDGDWFPLLPAAAGHDPSVGTSGYNPYAAVTALGKAYHIAPYMFASQTSNVFAAQEIALPNPDTQFVLPFKADHYIKAY